MARTIGIDIGSYSIKVAELEGQLKSTVVRDFYEIPLNHEPGQDLRLDKIEAIKKVAANYDASQYTFVVGLGSEFSTARVLNFPFLERRKILQSLPFELEDNIPFSQADAIFDFRMVHQKTNSSKVLAVAVPKKYIQEVLLLCEDAGLSPDIVTLEAIALANHFENYMGSPLQMDSENTIAAQRTDLIIHIGYNKTLIDVIQDRSLIASRALYFGGRDITNAVSRSYQLPYLEALKGVAEKGFVLTATEGADEDQIAFSQVISQSLTPLVTDLQRTIVDLKAELQCEFTEARLLGGMSRLINLGPYLSSKIDMPVSVFTHMGKTARSDVPSTEENDKASAVAIGLGIEGLRKPKNPAVNLRKNEFSKQNQTFQIFVEKYKNVAKIGAVLLVLFFVYSSLRSSFADDNLRVIDKAIKDQAKNPALNIPTSQLKPEALKKFIKAKREEIESKKQVARLNQMTSALDIVKGISSAIPSKNQITLDIKHLNIEAERVVLEGTVNNKNELDTLQRTLQGLSMVNKVTMGSPRPAANGKLPFTANLTVNRLPPAEKKEK